MKMKLKAALIGVALVLIPAGVAAEAREPNDVEKLIAPCREVAAEAWKANDPRIIERYVEKLIERDERDRRIACAAWLIGAVDGAAGIFPEDVE